MASRRRASLYPWPHSFARADIVAFSVLELPRFVSSAALKAAYGVANAFGATDSRPSAFREYNGQRAAPPTAPRAISVVRGGVSQHFPFPDVWPLVTLPGAGLGDTCNCVQSLNVAPPWQYYERYTSHCFTSACGLRDRARPAICVVFSDLSRSNSSNAPLFASACDLCTQNSSIVRHLQHE